MKWNYYVYTRSTWSSPLNEGLGGQMPVDVSGVVETSGLRVGGGGGSLPREPDLNLKGTVVVWTKIFHLRTH